MNYLDSQSRGDKVTLLYGEIQTCETLKVPAPEWDTLHRWDRKALSYYCLMKQYHDLKNFEQQQAKMDAMKDLSSQKMGKR